MVTIVLCLLLAGCGEQSSSSSTASESEASSATESTAATDGEVTVSDDIAEISDVTKGIAEENDAEGADEADALPTGEAEDGKELEASEMEEGDDDDSKYSGDLVRLTHGGVQMAVPATWRIGNTDDGFVLTNQVGTVVVVVNAYSKSPNEVVPLEDLAKATPVKLSRQGLEDVKVMKLGTDYSGSGTLCTSYVFYSGKKNGYEFTMYDQFVDSKSYVSLIEVVAMTPDFQANFDEINTILNSLTFAPGEAI